MSVSLNVIVVTVILLGFVLKYLIFYKEAKYNESKYADLKHFFTSKMILEFMVDIIIIFLGLFISMGVTQWDNDIKEKEIAVATLKQACEFAQEQYDDIHVYIEEFEKSNNKNSFQLELYTSLDIDYYDNIVSKDIIIKHLSTHTYGVFNKYLKYIEVLDSQIENIDDNNPVLKHQMVKVREAFFGRLITILDVCVLEASGELTTEEYNKIMEKIEFLIVEKDQTFARYDNASEYLVNSLLRGEN